MIADVHLEEHNLDVRLHPIITHFPEFQVALEEEARAFGMALVVKSLPSPVAVAAAGRAFARTLIESSSVDRTPEQWGEWFAAQPDAFYQLLAVADNHEKWAEWADGGS